MKYFSSFVLEMRDSAHRNLPYRTLNVAKGVRWRQPPNSESTWQFRSRLPNLKVLEMPSSKCGPMRRSTVYSMELSNAPTQREWQVEEMAAD